MSISTELLLGVPMREECHPTTEVVPRQLAGLCFGMSFCAICGSLIDLCDMVHSSQTFKRHLLSTEQTSTSILSCDSILSFFLFDILCWKWEPSSPAQISEYFRASTHHIMNGLYCIAMYGASRLWLYSFLESFPSYSEIFAKNRRILICHV